MTVKRVCFSRWRIRTTSRRGNWCWRSTVITLFWH
jgi:hypothetical protein